MSSVHDPSRPIYPATPSSSERAWISVDLAAVRHNYTQLGLRAGVPLIAMVKADAYGLGMIPVARALGSAFGERAASAAAPWALGVATLHEAAELRAADYRGRIFCSAPLTVRDLAAAKTLDVRPSLHDDGTIRAWASMHGGPWHLAIDTGMARAGVRWDRAHGLRDVLRFHPPEGVYTHFHSSEVGDGSLEAQDARFADARRELHDVLPSHVLVHSDNSAAIASRNGSPGHLARPGIALYGANELPSLPLRQTVRLCARIIDLREVLDGESVSYNATWRASGTRRIATVALGYADGYRRALSNRGVALCWGKRVPVVGNVTMDMTMLDVTDLGARCSIGDIATFIGGDRRDTLRTDAVAAAAGLSMYELLVGLRLRTPRTYENGDAPLPDSGRLT